MRNAHRILNWTILYLTAALILTVITGCAPISVSVPANTEHKPADVAAYSKEPRSQADVDKDVIVCREWATKSTNVDPTVTKKWPDTWVEWLKERGGVETEQARWNRYYGTCMDARKYSVR